MSLGVNLLGVFDGARRRGRSVRPTGTSKSSKCTTSARSMRRRARPCFWALLAAKGRDIALVDHSVRVRDGHTGAVLAGTVGFATLRGGSVIGEHSVILAGEGEQVTLSHSAADRSIFARGAVTAALWARGQKPGFYSMLDVLGLN